MTKTHAVVMHRDYRFYLHTRVQEGTFESKVIKRSNGYAKFLRFFVNMEWKELDEEFRF